MTLVVVLSLLLCLLEFISSGTKKVYLTLRGSETFLADPAYVLQGGEGTAVPEDSPVQQDVLFCGKDGVVSIEQVLPICGLQGQVVAIVLNSRRTPLFHINVCGASREGDNVIVAITVTGTERYS